jgi:hypothetical protein
VECGQGGVGAALGVDLVAAGGGGQGRLVCAQVGEGIGPVVGGEPFGEEGGGVGVGRVAGGLADAVVALRGARQVTDGGCADAEGD